MLNSRYVKINIVVLLVIAIAIKVVFSNRKNSY